MRSQQFTRSTFPPNLKLFIHRNTDQKPAYSPPHQQLHSCHNCSVPSRVLLCQFSRNSSVQNSSFSLSERWCAALRHQELPGRSALWSPCSPLEHGCLSGVGPDPLQEPVCLPGAALFHCLVGSVAGGAVCHW